MSIRSERILGHASSGRNGLPLKHTVQRVLLVLASLVLAVTAGCGGGGGGGAGPAPSVARTGIFIDSAVSGMQYVTKNSAGATTHSGITNALGEFQYDIGDTVTFSIGALVFPTVAATGTLTPLTLAGGSTDITTNQPATNIARLLQSLDNNGNLNDGITIPAGAAAVAVAVDFNVSAATFETNPAVINLVANSGSTTTSLVTEAAAQAHVTATMQNRIVGAWGSTGAGGSFSYLILFSDNTFAYGEYGPNVQEPLLENGLEVGTYSYDSTTGNITFNVTYDDNTSSTPDGSGVGTIGTPTITNATLSNGDKTLTAAGNQLVLSKIDFGISPISGVWRYNSGVAGEFSILMLTDDGVLVFAENRLNPVEPTVNGLEVGTYGYSSTTGKITINLTFDDNTSSAPEGSGVGTIGTPTVADAALSNGGTTLTLAGGVLVLTRDF